MLLNLNDKTAGLENLWSRLIFFARITRKFPWMSKVTKAFTNTSSDLQTKARLVIPGPLTTDAQGRPGVHAPAALDRGAERTDRPWMSAPGW